LSELQQIGDYTVRLMPCKITGKFDKCIFVKLEELDVDGHQVDICGQFSVEGLQKLIDIIQQAPEQVQPPSPEERQAGTPYMWYVVYTNGRILQQFPPEGGELHMGDADICNAANIQEFWIVPRSKVGEIPAFGFVRDRGFFKKEHPYAEPERLDFPYPVGAPFHWHYYRKIFRVFGMSSWGQSELPIRVVQVFGWCVPAEHSGDGQEVKLLIGVENDGSWQIWTREPLDHALLEEQDPRPIVGSTRIIDPLSV